MANESFAATLRNLRVQRNLSQQQLADMMYVDRSTIANWETGRRVPDVSLILRLSEYLRADFVQLLHAAQRESEKPEVILVDDEKIVLAGGIPTLQRVLPEANVTGFARPSEALEYARRTTVDLAILDIEMGKMSGLDLCRRLLEINQYTNVVFLTAYMDYSFDAWDTGACGFLMKPLSEEAIRKQLTLLKNPMKGLTLT
ncbi:MAG: response regulator [Lachnospiraceae bacterium]|nr:response regulator [Lachnospiraceae bacterium]